MLEDLHRKQNYMVEESKNTLKPNGNLRINPLHSLLCFIWGQGDGRKGNMNVIF